MERNFHLHFCPTCHTQMCSKTAPIYFVEDIFDKFDMTQYRSAISFLTKLLPLTTTTSSSNVHSTSAQIILSNLRCRHFRHNRTRYRNLSTSCVIQASKHKAKPILPSQSKTQNVVEVWKNMTVADVAKTVERPIDNVFEAMLYVKNADCYDTPKSKIDDIQVIRDIVKTLGHRSKVTSPPEKSSSSTGSTSGHTITELQSRPVVEKDLATRHPVVAIMGHVDHGKTTLLDSLRKTAVAASEAGGITQHIGAFVVETESGLITFLDTPGHAAFSALRQRGANGADLVILVVAADDGVMEQTKESIRMIKEANVPMIVALNKIDKGAADVDKAKRMLLQEGIQLEDFGGDVQCVPVSAAKGTNLSTLVESVIVQAEMLNLKSEDKGPIEGVVLESKVDPGRGKLCTALVQRGALRKSAFLVAGTAWAKVRGMFDENGNPVQKALPSTPVEIIGWRDLPAAGDSIYEVESEKIAKAVVEYRRTKEMEEKSKNDAVFIEQKQQEHLKDYKVMLAHKREIGRYRLRPTGPREKLFKEDTTIRLPVIIKADVDGSVEAVLDILETYDCHEQCQIDLVHYGVGDLTESDIKLAEAFNAYIYGFNVKISDEFKAQCKKLGIEFRLSNVIYRLVESMKSDISQRLPPKAEEELLGEASVLALFKVTEGKKKVEVAGSRCTKGLLKRDASFRIKRNEDIIFEGKIRSMRHLKSEVESIKNGVECGLAFEDDVLALKEGDQIICFTYNQIPQTTAWNPGF